VVAAEGDLLGGLRSMDHPVPYEPRTFAP
jgi:hypothetical protein